MTRSEGTGEARLSWERFFVAFSGEQEGRGRQNKSDGQTDSSDEDVA